VVESACDARQRACKQILFLRADAMNYAKEFLAPTTAQG